MHCVFEASCAADRTLDMHSHSDAPRLLLHFYKQYQATAKQLQFKSSAWRVVHQLARNQSIVVIWYRSWFRRAKKLLHPLVPLTRVAEGARSQREPPRRLLSWPSTPCQNINANGQRFVFPYLQKDVHRGHVTPSAAPCPASGWKTPIRCRTTRRPAASLRQRFSSPGRPSPPTRPAPEGR